MSSDTSNPVTLLLNEYANGDKTAFERLLPLVYDELRRLANSYLRRERADHTLQPTALVHEAYLKLIGEDVSWESRAHFFGIAARTMRQILVDYARAHKAEKRGAGNAKLSLDEKIIDLSDERAAELLALNDALEAFAELDPQKARLVELRFFGGFSVEEAAKLLGISVPTAVRYWRTAKAWLAHEIKN
jgi:RNA polymerase sigma factor (TIGR02999 family)